MVKNKQQFSAPKTTPFAGCAIIMIAVLIMGFAIGATIWNYFYLKNQLAKFTDQKPASLQAPNPQTQRPDLQMLTSKLQEFHATRLERQQPATLTLTIEDINLAIATFDEFEDLRKAFRLTAITQSEMLITISYPIRNTIHENSRRYLNASIIAQPERTNQEIILNVTRITPHNGHSVPDGFLKSHFSPLRITERYKDHPTLGPAMADLTSLTLADGVLTLVADPQITPPKKEITQTQVNHALHRILRFFGLILLAFIALIIFIRLKSSRNKSETTS